jgi:50S ribosomal subunit-associated GTPase HflX
MGDRRAVVALSKADLVEDGASPWGKLSAPLKRQGCEVFVISAVRQEGLLELKRHLYDCVTEEKARLAEARETPAEGVHVDRS